MSIVGNVVGPLSKFKSYGYYSNGNLQWSRDERNDPNKQTNLYYDRWFQAFAVCQQNPLGQTSKSLYYGVPGTEAGVPPACVTANGPATFTGNQFGQVYQETDANNVTTTFGYDVLGRLQQVIVPPDTSGASNPPTRVYEYRPFTGTGSGLPFWIHDKQRDRTPNGTEDGYLHSWTFYDGFGRVLQTQAEADNNGSTARHVEASFDYTWSDKVWHAGVQRFINGTVVLPATAAPSYSSPTWAATDQHETLNSYDRLGRLIETTLPDTSRMRQYYNIAYDASNNADRVRAAINQNNDQTITQTDPFGRMRWVNEYTGDYSSGPRWTDAVYARVQYDYNVRDQLTNTLDPGGNSTQIFYDDGFGRKSRMVDPDMGAWNYVYDSVGNLTRQTDAKNRAYASTMMG